MIAEIDKHINIINDSIAWAKEFKKDSFPYGQFKECRRRLTRIRRALTGNCSAAAYGESQVGKSYLMSSLLSSSDSPFVIEHEGKEYSFIDELNPSGGNNAKIESTGVITRFTLQHDGSATPGLIKILNLSVVDIILLLADSYYNDIKINPATVMRYDAINQELENLSALWQNKNQQHNIITEDDIKDIHDYIKDVIGNSAAAIYQSNFCKIVAPVIQYIPYDKWIDVFSLLWNKNQELNRLFATLINAYKKLDFQETVYVPFDAVLRKNGTLLKIEWLDTVCGVHIDTGTDDVYTDVFDRDGKLLASKFSKGELSALIAELTFELPAHLAQDRKFLQELDLLDFPGARSREKYKEKEIATVLPKMLRRGKVAYLFNKYSRSLQISSVLFCHHNDQKTEPTIGETINNWIENNIGDSPEMRSRMLAETNGIAPLFFVATKFNIDLERTKNDTHHDLETLDKHWNRFDTVLPEIIKPNKWIDEWTTTSSGDILPFQNIYPLRDFYWSGKNGLFDGYSDGSEKSPETAVHFHKDFPDYLDRLKNSFLRNKFVLRHFENPEETWESVATLNNDGSKTIIRNLDSISKVLDDARRKKYRTELERLKRDLVKALEVYFEPEDTASKNKKVREIAGDIRRALMSTVARDPASFGRIIDKMMVTPEDIRNIAYDILVLHTDTPRDFSAVNFYRAMAGIDISDSKESNVHKLKSYLQLDTEAEVVEYFRKEGYELEDVIERDIQELTSLGDVVSQHIIDYWVDHLNTVSQDIIDILPHADEVALMFINLFKKLNLKKVLSDKITRYTEIFSINEQPNAVGDFAALTLNNFVSTVGRKYISDNDMEILKDKALNCGIEVDFTSEGWNEQRKAQPLMETLRVFDEAATIVNQGRIDMGVLRKLPFWSNFQQWENFVTMGLLHSSDISHCDPLCNEKVKALIGRSNNLYTA